VCEPSDPELYPLVERVRPGSYPALGMPMTGMATGTLILLWVYRHASVKNWFTGPKTTIDQPVLHRGVNTTE
jgi:hypothetical protein